MLLLRMALNNCANIKIHRDNFHGLPVLYMFKGMKYCRFFSQKMKKDYHQFLYLLRIKFGTLENGLFRFLDCSYMKLLPYKYRIFVRIKQFHVNKYCQKQFTCNKWKEDFKSKNHKLSNYMITSIYNHVMDFLVSEK